MANVDDPSVNVLSTDVRGELRERIDRGLETLIPGDRHGALYDALQYALEGKGKRIRSTLALLAGAIYAADSPSLLDMALAVEVFHTFTLVHDDIMDASNVRRGRETVHVRWSQPQAILVGDLMLGMSYELISRSSPHRLVEMLRVHGETVRILCEGQMLDMQFETMLNVSTEEYLDMVDKKTGRLLSSSLQLGALCGGASDVELDRLSRLGSHLGRAFQIQDDVLDIMADDSAWGKPIGGDLLSGKKTFLLCSALEASTGEDRKWWQDIVAPGNLRPDEVSRARDGLEELGVLESAHEAVIFYCAKASRLISEIPHSAPQKSLERLIDSLKHRRH